MVVPLIEPRKAELAALCRQFGVRRLEVFGSAATGDYAVAPSDLDFLVEFDERGPARALGWYSGLEEAMEGYIQDAIQEYLAVRDDLLDGAVVREVEVTS